MSDMGRKANMGIYAFIRENAHDPVRYIGQSNDIGRRLEEHRRSGKLVPGLDRVERFPVRSQKDRDAVEARLIKKFEPARNRRAEPKPKFLEGWSLARKILKELR